MKEAERRSKQTKKFQRNIEASFSAIANSSKIASESSIQKQCKEAGAWYLDFHRQYSNEPDGPHKDGLKDIMDDAKRMYETAKEKVKQMNEN